jgi:dihydrofolate synthase/folylpolyglutamate synthase
VVLDAAHNLASIAALIETLDESFAPRRRGLIFGASSDKDVRGMVGLVAPRFDDVIFTRYLNNPRGVPPEKLAQLAGGSPRPATLCPSPVAAWEAAAQLVGPDDLLCITGSFFLAAEMRAAMARRPLAGDRARSQAPPEGETAPAITASGQEMPSTAPILR